jgi:endonuclease III
MRASSPLLPGAVDRLVEIDEILQSSYGAPEAELGNKVDPLDEAIYIILSFQTDLARFSLTWSRLKTAYPRWNALMRAPLDEVASVLREGGLHRQKALTIQHLLAEVELVTGELSLDLTKRMNDPDAERFLTRLPGLSWKGARCILLYSLRRDVFPIDGNTFRILKRTGVLPRQAVYRRRKMHDAVQAAIPAHRRRALHVNLVVHGQRICLPRAPQCSRCPLLATCPRIGLPAKAGKKGHSRLARSKGAGTSAVSARAR